MLLVEKGTWERDNPKGLLFKLYLEICSAGLMILDRGLYWWWAWPSSSDGTHKSRISPIVPMRELCTTEVVTKVIQYCSLCLNQVLRAVSYATDLQT